MVQPIRSPQRPHDVPEHEAATTGATGATTGAQRERSLRAGANPLIASLPAHPSAAEGASSSSSIEVTPVAQQRSEPANRAIALGARQRDIDAILAFADEIREIETQLLALKAPAQSDAPDAPDAPPISQAEVQQAIARLEARNDIAQRSVDTLGKQCERARAVVEKLNASLEEKSSRLEQLHEARTADAPVASIAARPPQAGTSRAELRAAHEQRIAALGQKVHLLKSSRSNAAREVQAVASRDTLRALGDVGTFEMIDHVSPELADKVTEWLHGLQPVQGRLSRRPPDPERQFQESFDTALDHIVQSGAAEPQVKPEDALQAFMALVLHPRLKPLYPVVEHLLVEDFARSLRVSTVARRQGKTMDHMNGFRRWLGVTPAQIATREVLRVFRNAQHNLQAAVQRQSSGVTFGEVRLIGPDIARAARQVETVTTALTANRAAFQAMIEAVEKQFAKLIDIDDIEALGQHVAPKLDAYYKDRIAEVNAERTRLTREGMPKAKTGESLSVGTGASHGDIDQLEIRIGRLQGEILQYAEQHKKEFEHYAKLSARHMTVSDEVEDVGQQLSVHRQTLKHLREGSKTQMRERAARGDQGEHLEDRLRQLWDKVTREPALSLVISRGALERVVKVHVGQTPEQMRTRMSKVMRTGTFVSRAGLLRVIAEVARHEIEQPQSALVAPDRDAFERIAQGYPRGRIDALCHHGRTIGHGVRNSARGVEESRTGTSQYALEWIRGQGARISHLHPWISPY
ncbi:UNVERIFIED_ORG: uncharacterized protein (DUF2267 family)/predicted nucleic acid-binding Zn-ribbon protein [Paraburkholderia sediminicola]|nr:uncharacterized protein (DUF2267 family)/predicted nucleic acid-binding Zn-ribbon protein [Paraburkholderia sediminicola]